MSFAADHLVGRPELVRRVFELAGVVFCRPPHGDEYRVLCPFHDDHDPSLNVNLSKGVYLCRTCGARGDAVDYVARRGGVTIDAAILEIRERHGIGRNGGRSTPLKSWEIRDAAGYLKATHQFFGYDADGKKKLPWVPKGVKTADLPLYGSERLASTHSDTPVILTEGEKAADALLERSIVAVGTVTGASGSPGARALEALRGREVILWPDNDIPGRSHMDRIAASLAGIARSVRALSWGHREGDDADDFFARGGTAEQLDSLLAEAPEHRGTPTAPAQPLAETHRTPALVRLDTVRRERVTWLWPRRIPFGKITMADGDPGLGKSTVTLDIAARVTRGREMPDGAPCEAGNVLILSAEDGLADTIRPRVDAAGGDASRITILEAVRCPDGKLDLFSLEEDIDALRSAVKQVRPKLVLIDPFSAYIGKGVDSHKDQEIRRVLAPLAQVGNDLGPAILLVRHLNKGKAETAIYRGGGSIGIIGAARSGLFFIKDPDDESGARILVATYKSNLCKPGPTLAYHVEGSPQDPDVAVIVWEETSDPRSAEKILAASGESYEERSQRGDARAFLKEYLAGGAQPAKDVIAEAKGRGIAEKTLRRALSDVGEVKKPDLTSGWVWRLR